MKFPPALEIKKFPWLPFSWRRIWAASVAQRASQTGLRFSTLCCGKREMFEVIGWALSTFQNKASYWGGSSAPMIVLESRPLHNTKYYSIP